MKKKFKVRKYKEKDFQGIVKAYKEGFPPQDPIAEKLYRQSPELIETSVKILVKTSDVPLVAEMNGEAKGLLTGEFPGSSKKPEIGDMFKALRNIISNLSNLGAILSFMEGAFEGSQYLRHYGNSDPSISFLTSQKDARGGIGTALVDKWVEILSQKGYDSTIVGTDERVNWKFYKKYGFEKIKDFYLIPKVFTKPKKRIRGFIYEYKIEKNKEEEN